jgi:LysM repeat protein
MGGLYTNQQVVKRRYLPVNIRRDYSPSRLIPTIGREILYFLRTVSNFLSTLAGILGSFFCNLGITIFEALKTAFIWIIDGIRYNPLVRKVAFATCASSFAAGAIFLVFFAISSPELPPENLISTIKDISEHHKLNEWSNVVLSSDGDWAELTTFNGTEVETGAGSQSVDRTKDFEYPVRPGETLSEIAYAYDIPYNFLAWYNKITNADKIRVGTVIIIPSLENIELQEPVYQQQRTQRPAATTARTIRNIEITHEKRSSGTGSGTTVHFSIVNPPSGLRSYEWDLGDGRRSFRESPSYEYTQPRTYVIRLTAQDGSGNMYRSNHLYVDIPHPASAAEHSTTKFVTIASPDDHFVVNGTITKVSRYTNIEDALDLSESDQFLTKARFKTSGYFGVTVQEVGGREQYYSIFVSPMPTMHVDYKANNFNWYRTQFNTGTPSNCGPASVAMGISWATGSYFPVSAVRQTIGWQGNGGTSFDELIRVIDNHGINASLQPLRTAQDIKTVIDSGAIAIVLFHTDGVRMARGNPATDLLGKYYNDSTGHYIVIKGYSLSGDYFVVHDPIPSDWGANSFRYPDEISMMGRNRYFPASEVIRSLRRGEMIVVPGAN